MQRLERCHTFSLVCVVPLNYRNYRCYLFWLSVLVFVFEKLTRLQPHDTVEYLLAEQTTLCYECAITSVKHPEQIFARKKTPRTAGMWPLDFKVIIVGFDQKDHGMESVKKQSTNTTLDKLTLIRYDSILLSVRPSMQKESEIQCLRHMTKETEKHTFNMLVNPSRTTWIIWNVKNSGIFFNCVQLIKWK